MEMFTLKCPHCHADLTVDNGVDSFKCKYCGANILLEGLTGDVLNARVRVEELEHEKYKLQHKSIEKQKEFDRRLKEETRENKMTFLWIGLVIVIFAAIFIGISNSEKAAEESRQKEISNLIQLQTEVNNLIDAGRLDEAEAKAEQLRYAGGYTEGEKWDNVRKQLLEDIKIRKKNPKKYYGIPAPIASSDCKKLNYKTVESKFKAAGFTNIVVND